MAKKIIESQIVDTRVLVDSLSGEVLNEETHTQTAYKTFSSSDETFCITYSKAYEYTRGLTGAQHDVLNSLLLKMMTMKDNDYPLSVELNTTNKKAICEKCGLTSMNSMDHILSQLVKRRILRRIGTGTYQFNPYLFWKGKLTDINTIRAAWDIYLNKLDQNST